MLLVGAGLLIRSFARVLEVEPGFEPSRVLVANVSLPVSKYPSDESGLVFFTTQILFDSNDIVWLIQQLNGLEARVFLSFAPVSHPRDLEFLRWLGADIPADLDRFLLRGEASDSDSSSAPAKSASEPGSAGSSLDRSLDLAQRILMDVFDNLPPDPPPLGLNVEHINQRNFRPALRMLEHLGSLYTNLVAARARPAGFQNNLVTSS